ncbi:hypothetical protein ETB97_011303 [Aspergillus alliaceus]|uniref:GPI anchored serine-threonine rich protein n=1 Tax=Petromyces alliaceus TaxID=209559 RepID=A0A8H6E9B0_PETAA|nr:hypothetical protein ETB97_011303 [Aspergillus burnettii]
MNKFLTLVALLATTALATNRSPALAARQVVELPCSYQGEKDCGQNCIPLSYTCCPNGLGGCPPGSYCDGLGCCPIGNICTGPGGVTTRLGSTLAITSTLTNTLTDILTNTLTYTSTSSSEVETLTSTPNSPPTPNSNPSSPRSVIPSSPSAVSPSSSTPAVSPTSPLHTGAASHLTPGFYAAAGLIAGVAIL